MSNRIDKRDRDNVNKIMNMLRVNMRNMTR